MLAASIDDFSSTLPQRPPARGPPETPLPLPCGADGPPQTSSWVSLRSDSDRSETNLKFGGVHIFQSSVLREHMSVGQGGPSRSSRSARAVPAAVEREAYRTDARTQLCSSTPCFYWLACKHDGRKSPPCMYRTILPRSVPRRTKNEGTAQPYAE